jgi:hypothetical protein
VGVKHREPGEQAANDATYKARLIKMAGPISTRSTAPSRRRPVDGSITSQHRPIKDLSSQFHVGGIQPDARRRHQWGLGSPGVTAAGSVRSDPAISTASLRSPAVLGCARHPAGLTELPGPPAPRRRGRAHVVAGLLVLGASAVGRPGSSEPGQPNLRRPRRLSRSKPMETTLSRSVPALTNHRTSGLHGARRCG